MIQAVLNGKSQGYEHKEDILTSTLFGMLKYIRPNVALIPFIESAVLYDDKHTNLWQKLKSDGIELRCYREVEYVFWSNNLNYGEPDIILVFRKHIHNDEDFLLLIEAKLKSEKSGTGENDQLARYYTAIQSDIGNFLETSVSGFTGKKGYIVYLTEYNAFSEILDSTLEIKKLFSNHSDKIFHLKWHQLYKTFEMMYPDYTTQEKEIVDDLLLFMDRIGLRDFSGISLPGDDLSEAFQTTNAVFYMDILDMKTTYFDGLYDLDINLDEYIFFGGE
jgi:hypothetical protein